MDIDENLIENPNLRGFKVDTLKIFIIILFIFFSFTHFYGLSVKPMHHDESIHANNSLHLFQGSGYKYDPTYHGPFLYYATAAMFYLTGDSDFTARLSPALSGIGIFILLALLIIKRPDVSKNSVWILVLLLLSPTMTYFSRFLRMDIFSSLFAVLLLYSVMQYTKTLSSKYFILAASAMSLLYVTKENSHITAFIFCSFPFIYLIWYYFKHRKDRASTVLELLVKYHILVKGISYFGLAEVIIFLYVLIEKQSFYTKLSENTKKGSDIIYGIVVIILFLILYYLLEKTLQDREEGTYPVFSRKLAIRNEPLFFGVIALITIFTLFYTNFLNDPRLLPNGLFKGLEYWMGQQKAPRIPGPFLYYLPIILIYELPLIFIVIAGVLKGASPWKKSIPIIILLAGGFFYSSRIVKNGVHLFGMNSWVIAISVLLLWLGWVGIRKFMNEGRNWDAFFLWWFIAAFFIYGIANEKVPWLAPHIILPMILLSGSILSNYFKQNGYLRSPLTVILLIFGLSYLLHSNILLNFYNESDPREILIYVQTSTDVKKVNDKVRDYIFRQGYEANVKIIVDNENTWPFAWYFRDLAPSFITNINRIDAPIILTKSRPDAELRKELDKNGFIGKRYRLRAWWIPEWERLFRKSWKNIFQSLRNYIFYRKTFLNSVASTDFMYFYKPEWMKFIKNNLNNLSSNEKISEIQSKEEVGKPFRQISDANKIIEGNSILEIGTKGTEKEKISNPKGLSQDIYGNLFVVDSGNNRIQVYDPHGKWLRTIGNGKGKEPGQFNNPQGVTVDKSGNVFVVDTWNHRIQKFDKNGKFIKILGEKLGMWGPRDCKIGKNGNLYIVDTGRTMVRVLSPSGRQIKHWGFKGADNGQFSEPVGMGFTADGNIAIADCGNQRIQILNPNGGFIRKFDVEGWQNFYSEPYLAIDSQGRFYVTDSDNNRILVYSKDGVLLKRIGEKGVKPGKLKKPKGILIDKNNRIIVSDSENNRIQVFQNPMY